MWLRISEADGESRVLEIRGERNVIGSDPGADIVIADEGLAPRHAELKALPDGRLEINDLGSGQPTLVGGQPIQGAATLEGGEEIKLGGATFEFFRERPGSDEASSASLIYHFSDRASAQATYESQRQDAAATGNQNDPNKRNTRFSIDWRFAPNFILRGSIGVGDEPSSGLDVLWQYRY